MSSRGSVRTKKFNRLAKQRRALKRSLMKALIGQGSIITTAPRAEVLAAEIRKMLVRSQSSSVHSKRQIRARLSASSSTINRLSQINGNLDRALKLTSVGRRQGDGAPMVRVELSLTSADQSTPNKKTAKKSPGSAKEKKADPKKAPDKKGSK